MLNPYDPTLNLATLVPLLTSGTAKNAEDLSTNAAAIERVEQQIAATRAELDETKADLDAAQADVAGKATTITNLRDQLATTTSARVIAEADLALTAAAARATRYVLADAPVGTPLLPLEAIFGPGTTFAFAAAVPQLSLSATGIISRGAGAWVEGVSYQAAVTFRSADGSRVFTHSFFFGLATGAQALVLRPFSAEPLSENAPAGTLVFTVLGVPLGSTPAIDLDDGRFVIAGGMIGGWKVVTGLVDTPVGTTNVTVKAAGVRSATAAVTIAADPDTVPEISTDVGGLPALVPQAFYDSLAREAADENNHPPMGPFTDRVVKDGKWTDPTIWDTGVVPFADNPEAGKAIRVCTMGFDVEYDVPGDNWIYNIHGRGTGKIRFSTTVQHRLFIFTFMGEGWTVRGEPGQPIPDSGKLDATGRRVPMSEIVLWPAEAPGTTVNLGFNTMGPFREWGAWKRYELTALGSGTNNGDILAGATSITFDQDLAAAGWLVGDEMLIPATEWAGKAATDPQYKGPTQFFYNGVQRQTAGFIKSQDEVRTIKTIVGNTVTFDQALAFDHKRYRDTLPHGEVVDLRPVVRMLSYSVRTRSADARDLALIPNADLSVLQRRGHRMHMGSDDVQIAYRECFNLGRSAPDPSQVRPDGVLAYATEADFLAGDPTKSITDPLNVIGRYSTHFHFTGPFFGRRACYLGPGSDWAGPNDPPIPGRGVVIHNSRVNCWGGLTYNVRGAGWMTERGNEIGQADDCLSAWNRSDAFDANFFGSRAENWPSQNGHQGCGWDMQARQYLNQNCRVTSSAYTWFSSQQGNDPVASHVVDEHSMRLRDPIAMGGNDANIGASAFDNDTYGLKQPQIPDFHHNYSFASEHGLTVFHRIQFADRGDQVPMIARGFHCVNTRVPFNLGNYTANYHFHDSLWIGFDVGAKLGPVSYASNFVNLKLKNGNLGFLDTGTILNHGGFWIDVVTENVGTFASSYEVKFSGNDDPTQHPAYGVMGPWTITNANDPNPGYTARPRTWAPITSADLPQRYPAPPIGVPQAVRDANPAPAIGGRPYFVPDADLDLYVQANGGAPQLRISGTLVDSVGWRRYPDYQNTETELSKIGVMPPRGGYHMTGERLVERNKCYMDGTTPKSRLWFPDIDRLPGEYFLFYVDVTLGGFTADFLAKHMVAGPNANKPVLPLKPEMTRVGPILPDLTKPVITSAASVNVQEGQKLAHVLKANKGMGKWAIGGADAAKVELVSAGGVHTLRFAADAIKDYEVPDDADANRSYSLTVTFTDQFGNVSDPQPLVINVLDVPENVSSFRENFSGPAGQRLRDRAGWVVEAGGDDNAFVIGDYGGALTPNVPTRDTNIYSPDIGSANQAVEVQFLSNGFTEAIVRGGGFEWQNGIYVRRDIYTPNLVIDQAINWQKKGLGNWPNPNQATVRVEVVDVPASDPAVQALSAADQAKAWSRLTVKYNGVVQARSGDGATSILIPSTAHTKTGLRRWADGRVIANQLDNFFVERLAV